MEICRDKTQARTRADAFNAATNGNVWQFTDQKVMN